MAYIYLERGMCVCVYVKAESWFCSLHMAEMASNLEDMSHLSAFRQIKGNVHAEPAAIDDLRLFSFGV